MPSRLTVAFMRAIPTRWADAILRRVLRLTPKHLAVTPGAGKSSSQLSTSRAA